ncbi:competence protein ComEC [Corynebacterium yudongzhengii]|uniref:ComEC/Rec2 family competence protein n=1 Tax=Corynebacterium yudongzhengii TaxID=2080740 RepID=A0A2U1T940_9CORY|nr:ComEC/Rec2 family competence protein [Corynebacterium yudongzhengii]AWB82443.1 competence protein ComEC [Corynebacterium yudongzhengii]PWC02502.1 ComEC/Rec2 family competence protein [Corynebacterium yudongzhengii]
MELRLVPAALSLWAALITLVLTERALWALVVIGVVAAVFAGLRHYGQAVLVALVSTLGITGAWVARWRAENFAQGPSFSATVATAPGEGHLSVHTRGYPEPLTVFSDDPVIADLATGARVEITAEVSESSRLSLGGKIAHGEITSVADPTGPLAFAAAVRERLTLSVEKLLDGEHRGLLPGMALGDTSLQPAEAEELYRITGLSHLSAVSGANVAIVTTAALLLCRAVGVGPRVQTACALIVLAVYILLVGTEPSVLRAGVTGLVGLVAVVASTRAQPLHALALAILVLLLVQPHLAVNYGFALSVAATVGIILISPVIAAPLIDAHLPPIVARAIAIAVAADVLTMPIISLMVGEVSVVAVVANILVAPAAAPVTILGITAAAAGPLAAPFILAAAPLTWWIHTVAVIAAAVPVVTVELDPVGVLIGYGWIITGLISGRVLSTSLVVAVGFVLLWSPERRAPAVDLSEIRAVTVSTEEEIENVPPGTQLIVVEDARGPPAEHPTVTREGVAVFYPERDGVVELLRDGTQRAQDGRF